MKRDSVAVIHIGLYVDDLLIVAIKLDLVLQVKKELGKRVEMAHCGEPKICLELEIGRDRIKLRRKVCKAACALKAFERFEMQDYKLVSTPMAGQIDAEVPSGKSFCGTKFCHAIRSHMCPMICAKPDIAILVGPLSQNMEIPTMGLRTRVKRVLWCI